jgi:hypothetical protein
MFQLIGRGQILFVALLPIFCQQIVCHRRRQGFAGAENPDAFFLGQWRRAAHSSKGNALVNTFHLQQITGADVQFLRNGLGRTTRPALSMVICVVIDGILSWGIPKMNAKTPPIITGGGIKGVR